MQQTLTAKVDAEGRVSIPQRIRDDLDIGPGDTLFLEYDEERKVLRYAKAENPFEALARHAINEWQLGKTRSIRDFAAEHGIDLDAR